MTDTPLPAKIPYSIRRSARARRVSVHVDLHDGVEVVVPELLAGHVFESVADTAVRELAPWIERRLRETRLARAQIAARAGAVPYLGVQLQLVPETGRTRVLRRGERLLVPAGDARPALERYYRRAARAEIAPRLDRAVALVGRTYSELHIRAQRTRWASCSSSGRMSFNWRLLLAPERVLEYVVWHEVCHLEIPDHSPRFWTLLERHWPAYRDDRAWLKRHGATLTL